MVSGAYPYVNNVAGCVNFSAGFGKANATYARFILTLPDMVLLKKWKVVGLNTIIDNNSITTI